MTVQSLKYTKIIITVHKLLNSVKHNMLINEELQTALQSSFSSRLNRLMSSRNNQSYCIMLLQSTMDDGKLMRRHCLSRYLDVHNYSES